MAEYYSQYSQDRFLDQEIFMGKTNGFFIDIGANDGITYSNTYFFEKSRNWEGICFEPIEKTFHKLVKNRSCVCLNSAVSKRTGSEKFILVEGYAEMLSGLKKDYAAKHFDRVHKEVNKFGGEIKETIVNTINLNAYCKEKGIDKIDYLSIDTEGSEYNILKSINFKTLNINTISVEANYPIDRIKIRLLFYIIGNYKLVNTIGNDLIFTKKQ